MTEFQLVHPGDVGSRSTVQRPLRRSPVVLGQRSATINAVRFCVTQCNPRFERRPRRRRVMVVPRDNCVHALAVVAVCVIEPFLQLQEMGIAHGFSQGVVGGVQHRGPRRGGCGCFAAFAWHRLSHNQLFMDSRKRQLNYAKTASTGCLFYFGNVRRYLHAILNRYDVEEAVLATCLRRLVRFGGCDVNDLRSMLLCTAGRVGKRKWLDPWAAPYKRVGATHHGLFVKPDLVLLEWVHKCPYEWLVWMILSPRAIHCWWAFDSAFADVLKTSLLRDKLAARLDKLATWAGACKPKVKKQYQDKLRYITNAVKLRTAWVALCCTTSKRDPRTPPPI